MVQPATFYPLKEDGGERGCARDMCFPPPSAQSGDLLGNRQMLVVRKTEDPADPLGQLMSAEQSLGLDHFAFGSGSTWAL